MVWNVRDPTGIWTEDPGDICMHVSFRPSCTTHQPFPVDTIMTTVAAAAIPDLNKEDPLLDASKLASVHASEAEFLKSPYQAIDS